MPTRRDFIKSAGLLTAALHLPLRGLSSTTATGGADQSGGLLFGPEDVTRIRANLELPRFATLRSWIFPEDPAANGRFLRDDLRVGFFFPDFIKACRILENASLAYVLTGDQARADEAILAGNRLCEYERWDYFLEGGSRTFGLQRASEAVIAFCLALDWLGDRADAGLRSKWERHIATKGAPACYLALYGMRYPDRVRGWTINEATDIGFRGDLSRWPLILNATNLKAMPTCGLGFAAILLHGRHPQAARWLEMSRQSARSYATMYGLDGSFDEGIGYWGYATVHLALLFEAMHRKLGVDDRRLINFEGSVRFALQMAMPTLPLPQSGEEGRGALGSREQDTVNFGDAGRGIDVSVAPWVARTFHDPLANYVGNHIGGMGYTAAAIWHESGTPEAAPDKSLLDVRFSNDIVVSRTGWRPEDGVVALRSGGPANHEHADRNSVIFKAHGERLFNDPLHASYGTKEPRWLLRQTEAHTAVLINGKGHQYHDGSEGTNASWASAMITVYRAENQTLVVTSDATEAYRLVNPAVRLVERTLVYLKPDVLVIMDRVKLDATAVPVQVRYQVYNDDKQGSAQADGLSFVIARPFATARAVVAATGDCAVRASRLDLPESEGIYPFAEIESAAALDHVIITACAARANGQPTGDLKISSAGGCWVVNVSHNGQVAAVHLALPETGPPQVEIGNANGTA